MRTANHLLTLVVVCAVLGFPLQSFAAKTVTVTMAGCALEAALKIVAAAAEVPITAEAGVRDCKVTLDVVNQPVAAVLDQICEQAGCDWEKHDGKYLLVAKGAGNGTAVQESRRTRPPTSSRIQVLKTASPAGDQWPRRTARGRCSVRTLWPRASRRCALTGRSG